MQRHITWKLEDKIGARRSPTLYRERRASLTFLYQLAAHWKHRHHKALVRYQEYQRAHAMPAVDSCLRQLIDREGGMNPLKWNGGYVGVWDGGTHGGSGAYGAPQALPGNKMASAGADWATNLATQIRWMQGYVQKYGGSCGALSYQIAHGSY